MVVVVFTIILSPIALAKSQPQLSLGGYDLVDIGGVEVLKNSQTGVINYYNAVAGAAGCGKWESKPTDDGKNASNIGGVQVDFHKQGYYRISYLLEPWKGRFAQLQGGQIAVFSNLDITTQNMVNKDDVERYAYFYSSSQEVVFNVAEPGLYTIGFGPYGGTLLPHSLAIEGDHLNATSIRFKLEPLVGGEDPEVPHFELKTFVDLKFKESADRKSYIVQPLIKHAGYISASEVSPDSDYMTLVSKIPGISQSNIAAIAAAHRDAMRAGYTTTHPFGMNAEFATRKLQELNTILANSEFGWNDAEMKNITAAKIAHYLWKISGRDQNTISHLNQLLTSNDYQTLIAQAITAVQAYLPTHFPQYQSS